LGSSLSRAAKTAPEDPAPTIMSSYSIDRFLRFENCCAYLACRTGPIEARRLVVYQVTSEYNISVSRPLLSARGTCARFASVFAHRPAERAGNCRCAARNAEVTTGRRRAKAARGREMCVASRNKGWRLPRLRRRTHRAVPTKKLGAEWTCRMSEAVGRRPASQRIIRNARFGRLGHLHVC
jgi:hypothetical protein